MNLTCAFALQLSAAVVVLVRALMWRLEWLERRPVTPRMKQGKLRRAPWALLPAMMILAGCLWWLGYPEPARWIVALCAGAPFLFATDRLWARLLRLDQKVTCGQCGDLGRLTVDQVAEAMRLHRDVFGHDCVAMSTRERVSTAPPAQNDATLAGRLHDRSLGWDNPDSLG